MTAALAYYLRRRLPTATDLPHSDETPVDNQLQDEIPQLLKAILQRLWSDRQDWFFAVDMALYYNPDEPAIVPDAFLALGVDRLRNANGRLSYLLWEEKNVMPLLAIEVVSQKYNGEYEEKLEDYQNLGVLYYAIYNPRGGQGRRFRKRSMLEVYKRVQGRYILQPGNPLWMPELQLGLGYEYQSHGGWQRDWLYWYDQDGMRYPTHEELYQQEQEQRLAAETLAAQSQSLATQEREQRRLAEAFATQEQEQRLAAEALAVREQEQRLAAEALAAQEQEQRRLAEERLAALEARLRAIEAGQD